MMTADTSILDGIRVAIIATDGVEQVELTDPRDAVEKAGATTQLISLEDGSIQAMNHDTEKADKFPSIRPSGTSRPTTSRHSSFPAAP